MFPNVLDRGNANSYFRKKRPMKSHQRFLILGLIAVSFLSCSDDSGDQTGGNPIDPGATIYSGPLLTFTKAANADFNLAENQDRITDNVWITRASSQGLYNIRVENAYNNNGSPEDTEWALGTLDQLESLTFTSWEGAAGGQNQVRDIAGKTFVVHLITDDIYLELTFLSWGRGGQGGGGSFSYERTTPTT